MSSDINFALLLDKYIYHVARNNGGRAFIGPGFSMEGFEPEEVRALQRAFIGSKRDYDLMTIMDLGGDAESMDDD